MGIDSSRSTGKAALGCINDGFRGVWVIVGLRGTIVSRGRMSCCVGKQGTSMELAD
jgi:hypothetical protein